MKALLLRLWAALPHPFAAARARHEAYLAALRGVVAVNLEAQRGEARRTADQFLSTIREISENSTQAIQATLSAVQQMAAVSAAQAEALKAHLDLFRVAEPPSCRVMNDEAEWKAEMEKRGFPTNGSDLDQWKALAERFTEEW